MLATTQGLVGEVITTLSIQLAEQHKAEYIVYIGSTLTNNEHLKKVIESYTIRKNTDLCFYRTVASLEQSVHC